MKKKYTLLLVLLFAVFIYLPAGAQMMAGRFGGVTQEVYEHTIREEAEGKELWKKLQANGISCSDLDKDKFELLGEYFMGQMMGDVHSSMNAMMVQVHGKEGEEGIHEVTGRRLSGCDSSASFPAGSLGWMPMMQMMWGGWSLDSQDGSALPGFNRSMNPMLWGFGNSPMGWGGGIGFLGLIFMLLWWAIIIAGLVLVVRWVMRQATGAGSWDKKSSVLEILKERYARGEIDRKEFEDKKKDLN